MGCDSGKQVCVEIHHSKNRVQWPNFAGYTSELSVHKIRGS